MSEPTCGHCHMEITEPGPCLPRGMDRGGKLQPHQALPAPPVTPMWREVAEIVQSNRNADLAAARADERERIVAWLRKDGVVRCGVRARDLARLIEDLTH